MTEIEKILHLVQTFIVRGYYTSRVSINRANAWHVSLMTEQPDAVFSDSTGNEYGFFELPIIDLLDNAEGQCDDVASSLTQFLAEHDIPAWSNYVDEMHHINPWGANDHSHPDKYSSLAALGYNDAPNSNPVYSNHTATFVTFEDEEFFLMIDMTANQYGYRPGVMMQACYGQLAEQGWVRLGEGLFADSFGCDTDFAAKLIPAN